MAAYVALVPPLSRIMRGTGKVLIRLKLWATNGLVPRFLEKNFSVYRPCVVLKRLTLLSGSPGIGLHSSPWSGRDRRAHLQVSHFPRSWKILRPFNHEIRKVESRKGNRKTGNQACLTILQQKFSTGRRLSRYFLSQRPTHMNFDFFWRVSKIRPDLSAGPVIVP